MKTNQNNKNASSTPEGEEEQLQNGNNLSGARIENDDNAIDPVAPSINPNPGGESDEQKKQNEKNQKFDELPENEKELVLLFRSFEVKDHCIKMLSTPKTSKDLANAIVLMIKMGYITQVDALKAKTVNLLFEFCTHINRITTPQNTMQQIREALSDDQQNQKIQTDQEKTDKGKK